MIEPEKAITIGDKIRRERHKQALTQEKLSIISELPYTTLTKIEGNVIQRPTIQTVIKIANGLKISINELIK